MDPKGKGMVVNDNEKESFLNEPRDDKPTDSGSSHKKRDGKKKRRIKKIIYYDGDASSSSPHNDGDDSSSKNKLINQNYSFDYSRIPYNSNAHFLSIPLGKPPHFDGEDYSFWSHKMHSHLFSLHPSIWEIVENGMHFDSIDNAMFINEKIHKNAQATTVLLASLCRDEYNKVSGLDNAKQIWDTLKISHEGNDAFMITKMELVEGELGRFAMIRGEEPTQTYNRLKTLVNKIRSYRSTRCTDHDVVRLMLRSFTVIDPHLVNLIRENPRYIKMTPEEILGKIVSGRMMVKEATSSKEALPSKVAQVEAVGLNEDEMALIIKRFKTALKGRKEYPNKNKQRESDPASNAVRLFTLLQIVLIMIVTRDKKRVGRRRKRRATGRQRARRTLERNETQTAPLLTLTMKDSLPRPSISLLSSPTNAIHVLWPRKRRYMFEIPLSTLLLAMMILPKMK
jgi:hypothetical protein